MDLASNCSGKPTGVTRTDGAVIILPPTRALMAWSEQSNAFALQSGERWIYNFKRPRENAQSIQCKGPKHQGMATIRCFRRTSDQLSKVQTASWLKA